MIVKEIVERTTSAPPAPPEPPKGNLKTGFPRAKRRLQPTLPSTSRQTGSTSASPSRVSVRESTATGGTTEFNGEAVPHLNFQNPYPLDPPKNGESSKARSTQDEMEAIQRQVEEENKQRVEGMSEEEREREKQELLDRFGGGLLGIMKKRKEQRERQAAQSSQVASSAQSSSPDIDGLQDTGNGEVERVRGEVADENKRRVESMSQGEWEDEVRDLEERFGKSTLEAIKRRAEQRKGKSAEGRSSVEDVSNVPGPSHSTTRSTSSSLPLEPTDPDSLKERYFKDTPSEPEKLAWLRSDTSAVSTSPSTNSAVRFDLQGNILSQSDMENTPTSQGLHHHGTSPDLAGYTIDDILWLSRSTVTAQRISMTYLLAGILGNFIGGTLPPSAGKAVQDADARRKGVQMSLDIVVGNSNSLSLVQAGIELLFRGLGGMSWGFINDWETNDQFRPEDDTLGIAGIPFDEIVGKIQNLLTGRETLWSRSRYQLITILRRGVYLNHETAEIIVPIIQPIMRHCVFRYPLPLDINDLPSLDALDLLREVVRASRTCASVISETDITDSLLRYLIVSAWPEDAGSIFYAVRYAGPVLNVFAALSQYGLSASAVTTSMDILRSIGGWLIGRLNDDGPDMIQLRTAYWSCLENWTICAIDPHETTPEHAVTWAQISALAWEEEAVETLNMLLKLRSAPSADLVAVLRYLNAWMDGVTVNKATSAQLRQDLMDQIDVDALRRIGQATLAKQTTSQVDLNFLEQIVRLDSRAAGAQPSWLGENNLIALIGRFMEDKQHSTRRLRYRLHESARLRGLTREEDQIRHNLELLSVFQAGDEPEALELIDQVLKSNLSPFTDLSNDLEHIGHRDKLEILRPLLHYAVLPSAAHVVGSKTPSHKYLKATTTLLRPPLQSPLVKREPGLPLAADWLFTPLNELLDSASSEAIKQAPPDWEPTELQIVRAMLVLTRCQLLVQPEALNRSEVLFNLMKVFMLEQGYQSSGDHPEVFRDDTVQTFLAKIISPYTSSESTPPISTTTDVSLETASKSFLGEMTFYQFYSDFLSLFEAISFSDRIFTQLVILPLSYAYPVDYRKLLWVEHPTALRSIRLGMKDLVLEHGSVDSFFGKEEDKDVLAGYTRSLLGGSVTPRQEFLWRVSTHHLASFLWADTPATDKEAETEEAGSNGDQKSASQNEPEEVREDLMRVIMSCPRTDVIREIVMLDVESEVGRGREASKEEVERRIRVVGSLLDDALSQRVRSLIPSAI